MRCDEIRDLLPLLPVDLLDPDELTAVRAHLDAGCPHCAAELAAYGQTLSLLPLVLPPQEPRPVVKARLMARALDEPPARAKRKIAPAPAPASPSRMPWAYAAAASIVLALISSLLTASLIGARHAAETASLRQRIEEQAGQMQRQSEEMASLRTQMRDARESIQLVSSPGVAVIDLQGQGSVKQASARVFWDRGRSFWQVYVASLPPAAAGRTYQLWFITSTAKISAGTFETGVAGEASHRVPVPAGIGGIVATAVTEEPAGGSEQPTGSILLLGKV